MHGSPTVTRLDGVYVLLRRVFPIRPQVPVTVCVCGDSPARLLVDLYGQFQIELQEAYVGALSNKQPIQFQILSGG